MIIMIFVHKKHVLTHNGHYRTIDKIIIYMYVMCEPKSGCNNNYVNVFLFDY